MQGRIRRYVAFESAKMQCRLGIYEACQKEDCFQHRFHLKKNNSLILLAVGVLFENRLDVYLHLLDGERGVAAFEGGDEVLAEDVAAGGVSGDFLHGVFGVVGVAHQAEVLPDDFFAGAGAQAGEIGVERTPAFDAGRVFVAEGDACAIERVSDDDFGFRADAHARAREEFGCVDFEGLAGVGEVLPCSDEILVGLAHGRHKGAAAGV